MRVYYRSGGGNWYTHPERPKNEENVISLTYNNWDDYGIKTTFNAVVYSEGEEVFNFSIKVFIEGYSFSSKRLNEICESGWDGFFPIPGESYLSVPSDIDFYSVLVGKVGLDRAREVLLSIRDAGYLINIEADIEADRLSKESNFLTSPLREAGARKAFRDGWLLFDKKESAVQDFVMNTISKSGKSLPFDFNFNSSVLPYDINVLIGPNGIGKSYTLNSLVEYWLGYGAGDKKALEDNGHRPFNDYPNISRLILISYSPFEDFRIDLEGVDLSDREAYKYFGFRAIKESEDSSKRIVISRNLPAQDSVDSLIKALSDDSNYGFMAGWKSKFETAFSVLQMAIGFDAVALKAKSEVADYVGDMDNVDYFDVDGDRYVEVSPHSFSAFNDSGFDFYKGIDRTAGVAFIEDGRLISISSGQRLFCYIVFNVVGQIRRDSLVVIDEPELFLHPTFEVEFIGLLKQVLKSFNSKAILATHSLSIAREVPARCVHVFRETQDGVSIDHPPFETFGGDMQRISSYVFGDNAQSKPFESWLNDKISEFSEPQDLISKLGNEINEEILIRILNHRRG